MLARTTLPILVMVASALVTVGPGPALATVNGQTVTSDTPLVRAKTAAWVWTNGGTRGPAQVNVVIGIDTPTCNDNGGPACSGAAYYPCAQDVDPVRGGCQDLTGYHYKVYTQNQSISPGIRIGNFDTDVRTGAQVNHNWARRVTRVPLEIYAQDPAQEYGNVRLVVTGFTVPYEGDPANQVRSASTGVIPMPRTGDAGVGRIAGYVTNAGTPIYCATAQGCRVNINYFAHNTGVHKTGSGNFDVAGFGGSYPQSASGYHTTRPLWDGTYDIVVKDNSTGRVWDCREFNRVNAVFSIDISKSNLGKSICTQRP